jgi:hypothetical protein
MMAASNESSTRLRPPSLSKAGPDDVMAELYKPFFDHQGDQRFIIHNQYARHFFYPEFLNLAGTF